MHKNFCTPKVWMIVTIVVALLFGGSLLLAFWGIPRIIRSQIHSQTELIQGTEQWDRFEELPFTLDYTVRFMEVANPLEVYNNNTTPIIKESAPYVYKYTMVKNNITFDDDDEDSVTYKRGFNFTFDHSGSTNQNDNVTIINPLLMAALQMTNFIERIAFAGCLDQILKSGGLDTIFITKPVHQILFDGINFGFSNETGIACEVVRKRIAGIVENIRVIEHLTDPDGTDYYRIALLNYKTGHYLKTPNPDGIYTVNRGRNDMTALGNIMRWNGKSTVDTYGTSSSINNDTCRAVRGTDSTIYRPMLQKNENLFIFNTDICRTVELHYISADASYQGIKAYRYETSKDLFRPTTANPENDCFCTKATADVSGNPSCFLDGLFDFKPCLGAPILVSQPHFLNADEKYLNALTGLKPDKTAHGIYLLLEPNTGSPLEGMRRIQLNSVLRKEPLLSMVTPDTMSEGVIPVIWVEEGFSLPQDYVDKLNNQFFKKIRLANGLKYGLIATLAALLAGCTFIVWRQRYFNSNKKINVEK